MTKRILSVLAVAALMAAMVAAATLPAFAAPGSGRGQPTFTCEHPITGAVAIEQSPSAKHFFLKEGFTCERDV
jgi:hypothetical protein